VTAEKLSYRGQIKRLASAPGKESAESTWGDTRDGSVYLVDPELRLSAEIAIASNRPLLLRGRPGSGKSSLAAYLARNLKARYYELVVTSRTQAQDVLWSFDNIRKLADAQARIKGDPPLNDYDYVEPGVLWWVLNRRSAFRRGAPKAVPIETEATEPNASVNAKRSPDAAVVLIDEIDKADPDVPNGLLVPIGSSEFTVQETRTRVRPLTRGADRIRQLLITITTNETRDLPDAFVRRCVVHYLDYPDEDRLVRIAKIHGSRWRLPSKASDENLCREVARRLIKLRREAKTDRSRPPSTAEYLDAIKACRALDVNVGSEAWQRIERVCLLKKRVSGADGQDTGSAGS